MKKATLLRTYSGLDRGVYVLFLARIVSSMGNFVFPFLTMFLTEKLHFTPARAGTYIVISGLAFIPGSLLGGKLSDHLGRKRIMLLFQALAALCLIPCAFLGESIIIVWLLILSSFFFGGVMPASSAILIDLTDTEKRKAAFSLLYLGHNIGFAIGPIIAGFLFNNFIEWIFLGDALTTGVALLLVFFFVAESLPAKGKNIESLHREANLERAEKGSLLKALWQRPFLLAFIAVAIMLAFIYSQCAFSLPLQLLEIFKDAGPGNYGLLMSANAIVVISLTTLVINFTNRIKPVLTVSMSSLLYAAGFGMIFFIRSMPMFLISTVIWTVGEILAATNTSVYIANHTPITHRGRFNAIIPIIHASGFAVSPLLIGLFIEKSSLLWVWPLLFLLGIIAAAALFLLYRIEKKAKSD
jgi:MFS family permease